jgi:hypothetical protein
LLDDSSDNDSVESGYASAQDEFELAEEEEDTTESVIVTAPNSDAQWMWHDIYAGCSTENTFFRATWSPKHFDSVLDTFLLFSDEIITLIVQETNRYAEKFIQGCTLKPRSCIRNWEPVMR